MIFRKATKDDVIAIVELLADDELGKTRENFKVPLPRQYQDAFYEIVQDHNQELIVLEDNSEIIGTLQLSFIRYLTHKGGLRAQIEAVRIKATKRGLGLGKKMFEHAIEKARERNAHVVQLTTDKRRPDALNFYKELGFLASHEGLKLHM